VQRQHAFLGGGTSRWLWNTDTVYSTAWSNRPKWNLIHGSGSLLARRHTGYNNATYTDPFTIKQLDTAVLKTLVLWTIHRLQVLSGFHLVSISTHTYIVALCNNIYVSYVMRCNVNSANSLEHKMYTITRY